MVFLKFILGSYTFLIIFNFIDIIDPMNIPVEDWSKQLQEAVLKSKKLIAHYEMLCEEHKVCVSNF